MHLQIFKFNSTSHNFLKECDRKNKEVWLNARINDSENLLQNDFLFKVEERTKKTITVDIRLSNYYSYWGFNKNSYDQICGRWTGNRSIQQKDIGNNYMLQVRGNLKTQAPKINTETYEYSSKLNENY